MDQNMIGAAAAAPEADLVSRDEPGLAVVSRACR